MPIHTPATVTRDASENLGNPCGPYEALLFSDTGGLTQFGAFVEILPPGSSSSIKHWHSDEDEMVYMLEGEALVHEGDRVTPLRPGDAATFKAGVPEGHCIENASAAPARYLVIGTRTQEDRCTYPEKDCILIRTPEGRHWETFDGTKRGTPYTLD